jgi:hypothetical protein
MAEFKPDDLAYWDNECSKAADVYAEYFNQEKLFQVLSAAKLAALVMGLKEEFKTESNVALEMRARASEGWQTFVLEQVKLLKEHGRARIKYEDCNRHWETARSLLAQRREEFKRIS